MYWYYGGGAHIAFWNAGNSKGNNNSMAIGIDGVIGMEYNFKKVPINISLDWKPALNLIGGFGFWGDGGTISIRYVFN